MPLSALLEVIPLASVEYDPELFDDVQLPSACVVCLQDFDGSGELPPGGAPRCEGLDGSIFTPSTLEFCLHLGSIQGFAFVFFCMTFCKTDPQGHQFTYSQIQRFLEVMRHRARAGQAGMHGCSSTAEKIGHREPSCGSRAPGPIASTPPVSAIGFH